MSTVKSMAVSTTGLRLGAHLHPMAVDSLQDGSTLVKTLEPKVSIVKLLKVSVFAPHLCRSNQVGISHLATSQLNFFTTSSPSGSYPPNDESAIAWKSMSRESH